MEQSKHAPSRQISDLLDLMIALRHPETGCAWDLKQTLQTLAPYTIEEAYEVVDAIERGNIPDLKDELGDLLLQVVFQTQVGKEQNLFDFGDVVEAISTKLIRRHPHIFGDQKNLTPEQVKAQWDEIKQLENKDVEKGGLLSGIASGLPPVLKALKLTKKAASVGFDWTGPEQVLEKIREETQEVQDALKSGNASDIEDEIGDLFFAVVNLARKARVDPEKALRGANVKFVRRFDYIEESLRAQGISLENASLDQMEELWGQAKNNNL